jgi:hypothetical protein
MKGTDTDFEELSQNFIGVIREKPRTQVCPGRYMNPEPPEHKAVVLIILSKVKS